jgi:hypothetical protein
MFAAVAPARAVDSGLNGDYADEGVIVKADAKAFPHGVSLHALLSLEFEPALARKLKEQAAHVVVRQENGAVEIKVYDHDGAVIKQGRWKKDAGPNGRVILRFSVRDEEYFFRFETTAEQRLLQVTIDRNEPTILGPAVNSVGTFLFPRID